MLASPLSHLLCSCWRKAELAAVASSRRKLPAPLGMNFPHTHSLPHDREIPKQSNNASLVPAEVIPGPLVYWHVESDAQKFWKMKACFFPRWYKQARKQRRHFLSSGKRKYFVFSNKNRFKNELGFLHLIKYLITTSLSLQYKMQEAYNHFPGQMLKSHCI